MTLSEHDKAESPPLRYHGTVMPDVAKGEYLDENDQIRVCRACAPGTRAVRHTCGLAKLQDMLTLPGPRSPR